MATTLTEQILRAAGELSEDPEPGTNLYVAKQQLVAAYRSGEGNEVERMAEHLCYALHALIQELQANSAHRNGARRPDERLFS